MYICKNKKQKMSILSSKQIKIATGLIKELGFKLVEYNTKSVLKLQKENTTIYLFPKKQNHEKLDH